MVAKMFKGSSKGQFGFILTAAGSAIGLGNLLMFPYKVGEHGGSIFVYAYLFFALAIGLPLMIAEFAIGRSSKNNSSIRMFRKIPTNNEKRPLFFSIIGVLGTLACLLIAFFYTTVAGWCIEYFLLGIYKGYDKFSEGLLYADAYYNFLKIDFHRSTIYSVAFLLLTLGISYFDLKKTVTKISKILMPSLILILIGLVIYNGVTLSLKDTAQYLFVPTLTDINGNNVNVGRTTLAAMSQAFFSLSLGFATMITFASYMNKETKVVRVSTKIVIFDTLIAILTAFAVFPILISLKGDLTTGISLVFNSFVIIFSSSKIGQFIGVCTFALFLIAGLTSLTSMFETIVSSIIGGSKLKRRYILFFVGLIIVAGTVVTQPSLKLSIPALEIVSSDLMSQLYAIALLFIVPIVSFLTSIFVGYRMKKELVIAEFRSHKIGYFFYKYIRYVVPTIIALAFIFGLLALFGIVTI